MPSNRSKRAGREARNEKLDLELVPRGARLQLTRMLREQVRSDDPVLRIGRQNRIINIANQIQGRGLYVLEADQWGEHLIPEYTYHDGEMELVAFRPSGSQLAELLMDFVRESIFSADKVNELLEEFEIQYRITQTVDHETETVVVDAEIEDVAAFEDDDSLSSEHRNVRALFDRMDRAIADKDWPLVLHACASALETIAKQVVANPNVQDRSLGSWFAAFRKQSSLVGPLLDVVEEIFTRRNVEALAGHGSIKDPTTTEREARITYVLTKALALLERQLATSE